jgi:hypothetical protein
MDRQRSCKVLIFQLPYSNDSASGEVVRPAGLEPATPGSEDVLDEEETLGLLQKG